MDKMRKREFPFYYAEDKELFHIVAKMSDQPGSFSKILNILAPSVNFVGINTYTLADGTAVFSGFAEGLKKGQKAEDLKGILTSANAVIDAEVMPGKDGILVDTFHIGLEAHGDSMMIVRRKAMRGMLARICTLLGTGGETLLYEEGKEIGRINTEETIKVIGLEKTVENIAYLRNWLAAIGWGSLTADVQPDGTHFVVRDCFECAHADDARTGCHFFRGYIVGSRGAQHGQEEHSAKEVKCTLRGDEFCEFVLSPK